MSENLNNQNKQEEVDLLQLFGFFEKKIKSFFRPFYNFFASILNLLVLIIQYLFQHYIKVSIIVLIAFVSGFVYDAQKGKVFESSMTVKPFFKSQYQFINNVNYYNELALNGDYNKLSTIFGLSTEEAKSLISFSYESNINNENIKKKIFDHFVRQLDSVTVLGLDYKVFSENITDYDARLFELKVKSSKKDVFFKLSKGFRQTFESDVYSRVYKLKKEALYNLKKDAIKKSLSDIDSMRKVYVNVLSKEKSQNIEMLGSSAVKLSDEQQQTKELEMLELQISEQEKLEEIEQKSIEETELFEVISDFQYVGSPFKTTSSQMKFVFPFLVLIIVILFFLTRKFKNFILTYKAEK